MSTNFSDTTPVAVSGTNVKFQKDSSDPRNVSGYIVDADATHKGVIAIAGHLTGTAAVPTVRDATASLKGVIQLAGDLGGTAAAPTNAHGPYDLGIPVIGQPDAAETTRFTFPRTVTFAGNFVGSYAKSASAAAASTVFTVKQNGGAIGHVAFALASSTGTFDTTGGNPVTFAAGDLFELVAPGVQDLTWANGNFTFAGTR